MISKPKRPNTFTINLPMELALWLRSYCWEERSGLSEFVLKLITEFREKQEGK